MSHQFRIYAPAVLLVIIAFVVAFQFIKPAPPDRVVMATGNPQGAYHAFATAYAEHLAAEGIELQLVNTAGSVENLQLLDAGGADIGFVQSGLAELFQTSAVEGLGTLALPRFARRREVPRLGAREMGLLAEDERSQREVRGRGTERPARHPFADHQGHIILLLPIRSGKTS